MIIGIYLISFPIASLTFLKPSELKVKRVN